MTQRPGVRALLLTLCLLLVGAGGFGLYNSLQPPDGARDLDGNTVVLDDQPTAADLEQIDAVDDVGMRVVVPAVGMDVPLGEMNEVDGQIRPPGFTSAYLIRNRGASLADAAEGTIYVATHSIHGGKAPGNFLIDVDDARATVEPGDDIYIGNLHYRVDSWRAVPKSDLPDQEDLWNDDPGRLVLLTCLQRPQGRARQNVVIAASLAEDPSAP
ncbi:class F sortase [Propionicicella superfundia]|uniref:class F sortase n=1 Tax=Propionicicella superfundia TaxID=348582 RepID=UPI00041D8834|nr:class F sortase [Propionicicella superfundia]